MRSVDMVFDKKRLKLLFTRVYNKVIKPYRFIKTHFVRIRNRIRYSAYAHPNKIIWVRHEDITHICFVGRKEVSHGEIIDTFKGRAIPFEETEQMEDIKYKAICEHFGNGTPWEETELFDYYREMFAKSKIRKILPRKCRTIEELAQWYRNRIDTLFEDMKNNGFRMPSRKRPKIKPLFYFIGSKGEILIKNGKHRLHIARFLGIEKIPCKIWARHIKWQKIRDDFMDMSPDDRKKKYPQFLNHPDLQDIINEK